MARTLSSLPRSARLYLTVVMALGTLAIADAIISLIRTPVEPDWLVLAALTLLTGSFGIKVPSLNARISVSEAFVIAAVLSFGPDVATVIVALDSLILTTWSRKPNRSPVRAFFNVAAAAVAISTATRILEWIVPVSPAASLPLDQLLLPVAALAISYFLTNSWLIAVALGYELAESATVIWWKNFLWLGLNYLGGASVALVLVTYTRDINLTAVGVIIPLMIVLYLTFRTSWGRVEDANRHVAQVNELYLSTIEALAMAVDAKDQITHGHIRRVQVFAVELAKRLGVSDDGQLKAIATAALLHDMGKLAIPEHILNKPGKLTPAEFEKMKQHAEIGADLLSSVKFPYAVVPIVRHHHEHWDGNGYPARISGTDIPLGARILAVVDCFDALTSDRPYRPRLSADEAFGIIRAQRGSMYDPLVVDIFVRTYSEIAPAAIEAGDAAKSVISAPALGRGDDSSPSLRQIRSSASETALLETYEREMTRATSSHGALGVAAQYLRQVTKARVYALFTYDPVTDSLACTACVGDERHFLRGLTIRLGERVTGWVAANKRTSLNSAASLDLGEISQFFDPPLLSTISAPLVANDALVGVLTGYSHVEIAIDDRRGYVFEHGALSLANRISSLTAKPSNVVPFASPNSSPM